MQRGIVFFLSGQGMVVCGEVSFVFWAPSNYWNGIVLPRERYRLSLYTVAVQWTPSKSNHPYNRT